MNTHARFSISGIFQNENETMSSQLEQAETKAIQLTQKNSSLESQLADAQVGRISYKNVLLYDFYHMRPRNLQIRLYLHSLVTIISTLLFAT